MSSPQSDAGAARARTVLGAARLAVGATSLLAPSAAVRVFGMDPRRSTGFVTRLFASRELVLAGLLLAARGEDVRRVAVVGAGVDAIDVASSVIEYRAGRLSRYALVAGGAGAAVFAGLGVLARGA